MAKASPAGKTPGSKRKGTGKPRKAASAGKTESADKKRRAKRAGKADSNTKAGADTRSSHDTPGHETGTASMGGQRPDGESTNKGAAYSAGMPGNWQEMLSGMMSASQQAMMQSFAGMSDSSSPSSSMGMPLAGVHLDPEQLSRLQAEYSARVAALFGQQPDSVKPADRRFGSPEWQQGLFGWNAALYELNAEFFSRMAGAISGPEKDVQRIRFAVDQWIDAMSPSNFLMTNPQAQKTLIETQGRSLQAGMQNLIEDIARGRISQTDEDAFVVGENLAVTPGDVVFENELFQLIQYAPSTPKVGSVPMLMVPPCINKFYILDLQPSNSVVAWLVDQGHTVFMLSWKNVQNDQGGLTWDDYLDTGVITAINTVREICDVPQINALGFCVGGTIISTALAVMAARGEKPVASLTLLTTLLDFEDPGVLNLFVDEAHVSWRESTLGHGGLMPGAELAQTFSALRPNDLIWNYVSRNYLQGEKPPAFDLLYWNSDSTNLPGPMFAWYLRHMYLQNDLVKPNQLTCLGQKVDLARIDVPVFIYGSRDDHIVPWHAAYGSRSVLGGPTEFVLGASGHIAGVINHPAKNKRNYWVNDSETPEADEWLASASRIEGSWWPHWADWLASFSGRKIKAPSQPGGASHHSIEPAPGRYVRQPA